MEELRFVFDEYIEEIMDPLVPGLVSEPNEPKPKPKPKRKKITRNYINNEDFKNALLKYKEDCETASTLGKPKPKIPNYIGECFIKLAEGLARRPNFFGYSYKDEMISDGIENCLMCFENFDTNRNNPFAYFTQILWWCFVRRIKKERKQQYIKYKATENFGVLDEAELISLSDGQLQQMEIYDNMYVFIEKYEKENELKKVKGIVEKKKKSPVGIETFLGDE